MIIDEKFFEVSMQEVKSRDIKSYPVEVVALRVGWVIQTQAGYDLLIEMANSENLDFYKVKTI